MTAHEEGSQQTAVAADFYLAEPTSPLVHLYNCSEHPVGWLLGFTSVTNTVNFLASGKTKYVNAPLWWRLLHSSVGNKDETNEIAQPFSLFSNNGYFPDRDRNVIEGFLKLA